MNMKKNTAITTLLALTVVTATSYAGRGPEVRFANQGRNAPVAESMAANTNTERNSVRNDGGRNGPVTHMATQTREDTHTTSKWRFQSQS
ncbi:MAG TPA: hypothetical protein DCX06_12010 [Opitutae bacterium]|nr:hypothetical protein [Opitutae bacterium]